MLAATVVAGAAAPVSASPPDDDGDDETGAALEQFVELAEGSGYVLVDPACSGAPPEGGGDLTFTCYAMTTTGEPFIARTTLSPSDVVQFEILVAPGQPADAGPAVADPSDGTVAAFDPLVYFDTLFSGDAAAIATLQATTAPGSPAEAYALYQLEFAETIIQFEGEIETSYVYLTPDGVLVCVTAETCVTATDLDVVDGLLADFSIDGEPIAPRLGRPGPAVTVGPATVQPRAAYRAVTGADALRVYLELSATEDLVFELSNAVYVGADGALTPVDRETSIGAVDGTVREQLSIALDFPAADPGGELRFLVFPRGGAALALVVPIEGFTANGE